MQYRTFLLWVLSLNWKPPVTNNLLFGWIVCNDLLQKEKGDWEKAVIPGFWRWNHFRYKLALGFSRLFFGSGSFQCGDFGAKSWKMLFLTFFGRFTSKNLEQLSVFQLFFQGKLPRSLHDSCATIIVINFSCLNSFHLTPSRANLGGRTLSRYKVQSNKVTEKSLRCLRIIWQHLCAAMEGEVTISFH